ncbi:hypothetical protein Hypma_003164, partial [Hypsizygus marmoreus]
ISLVPNDDLNFRTCLDMWLGMELSLAVTLVGSGSASKVMYDASFAPLERVFGFFIMTDLGTARSDYIIPFFSSPGKRQVLTCLVCLSSYGSMIHDTPPTTTTKWPHALVLGINVVQLLG